eukprot:gnl/TRDRNA2_/TRDRNA2_133256_c0_seq1.p1 gnl/TRDRNA2_/TRDRNA2_133256_c0~~gnl/TRDRNA2_/TRDRNA2_133256_c0_seq1.p1  ORF type:complete len:169 (-),score=4.07 gnl/TRDRNA2_/TRDRNA2_133256_c0_seq1:176-682(-)
MGVAVYLRYGEDTTSSAIETVGDSLVFQIARLGGIALVVLSYAFVSVPARHTIFWSLLGQDEVKQEATYATFLLVTVGVNLTALALGIAATYLGGLSVCVRFSGSVCATSLALIFPPALFISVRSTRGWNFRVLCGSRGGVGAIFFFGLGMFLVGNQKLATDLMAGKL